jgi:small GTP-binding protein
MRASSANKRSKVLFVGAQGCGKTSLLSRLVDGVSLPATEENKGVSSTSMGCDMYVKETTVNPNSNEKIALQLWDTVGNVRFRPFVQLLYPDTTCVVICYDISNSASFKSILYWHNEILRACPAASMLLVGCKSDSADVDSDQTVVVSEKDGMLQAKEWKLKYIHCSAKTGKGCDELMTSIIDLLNY